VTRARAKLIYFENAAQFALLLLNQEEEAAKEDTDINSI
jgi:hypothetical protein